MAAYSIDLRLRVLRDADAGLPSDDLAEKYSVSRAWVAMWRSYAFPLPSSSCTLAQPRCHRSRGRTNTDRLPDQQRMAQAPVVGCRSIFRRTAHW